MIKSCSLLRAAGHPISVGAFDLAGRMPMDAAWYQSPPGIDKHKCIRARRELYLDGVLAEGMVFTIAPGLYFRDEDLSVPAEFCGIGVWIEDDVLVTAPMLGQTSVPPCHATLTKWSSGFRFRR